MDRPRLLYLGTDLGYFQQSTTLLGAIARGRERGIDIIATHLMRRTSGTQNLYAEEYLPDFPDGMFSGFAVFGAHLDQFLNVKTLSERLLATARGTPVISFNIELPGIPGMLPENRDGIIGLVRHLKEHHFIDRFAFLIRRPEGRRFEEWELRARAFREAMVQFGIPPEHAEILEVTRPEQPNPALDRFLRGSLSEPRALLCQDDEAARMVFDASLGYGISLGRHLFLTGFSDFRVDTDRLEIPLTTYSMPLTELGRRSVDWLLEAGLHPNRPRVSERVPGDWKFRATCGCNEPQAGCPPVHRGGHPTLDGDGIPDRPSIPSELTDLMTQMVRKTRSGGPEDWYFPTLRAMASPESMRTQADHWAHEIAFRSRLRRIRITELERTQAESLIARLSESLDFPYFFQLLTQCLKGIGVHDASLLLLHEDQQLPRPGEGFPFADARTVYAYSQGRGSEITEQKPAPWISAFGPMADAPIFHLVLPLLSNNQLIGLMSFTPGPVDLYLLDRLAWKVSAALFSIRLLRLREETIVSLDEAKQKLELYGQSMKSLSQTDELTGLRNRRGFISQATPMLQRGIQDRRPYGLLFIDMDGLKSINDTHGHTEGDAAIKVVAESMKATFRESDLLARFGGDEFVVFAPNCDPAALAHLVDRLRSNLEMANRDIRKPYRHSVSVGIHRSVSGETRTLESLLELADALLYQEKRFKKGTRS